MIVHHAVPSGAPIVLTTANPLPNSVTLEWGPPPLEYQNGDIINYMIEFMELGSHNSTIFFSNSTFLNVAALQPYTTYSFSVSAATALGFGPASEHQLLQTAEDGRLMGLMRQFRVIHSMATTPIPYPLPDLSLYTDVRTHKLIPTVILSIMCIL